MPIEIESPEEVGYDTIDYNLSDSSTADRRLRDCDFGGNLGNLLLSYGDHRGDPVLRAAIAATVNGIRPDDVIATPGAAGALFCVATSLLEPDDHMIVVRPNYATNLEIPRAIGAEVDILDLAYENRWQLDLDLLKQRVRRGRTRLISITCPHNPTGSVLSEDALRTIVALAEDAGAVLLVDETYRDLTHQTPLPMAATLSPRAISVGSMSKAFGLPGLRVGWAVCRDPALATTLLAAKEQMVICGSTLDETIAARILARRTQILPSILDDVRYRLEIVREWFAAQDTFEWVPPCGGVVGLARIRPELELNIERFYNSLRDVHRTYVGRGHWFELSDRYFRIGFGWPTIPALRAGLLAISASANASYVRRTP